MEYIYATSENLKEIYQLVRDTVTSIYLKYYPQEVVDFFHWLHSKKNILKDIESGLVRLLVDKQIEQRKLQITNSKGRLRGKTEGRDNYYRLLTLLN